MFERYIIRSLINKCKKYGIDYHRFDDLIDAIIEEK